MFEWISAHCGADILGVCTLKAGECIVTTNKKVLSCDVFLYFHIVVQVVLVELVLYVYVWIELKLINRFNY